MARKVGRFQPPGGSPGGSRRVSGRWFWQHFCCKACRHEKYQNFYSCFFLFSCYFRTFCVQFFFAVLAATAPERTLKKQVFVWKVLHFSCLGRWRAERKIERNASNSCSKPCENSSKNACIKNMRKTFKNHPKITKNTSQKRSRRPPAASCEPGSRPEPPKIAPGGPLSIKILFFRIPERLFSNFHQF